MLEAVASGEKLAALLEAPEARSDKVAALGLPASARLLKGHPGGTPKIWHTQSIPKSWQIFGRREDDSSLVPYSQTKAF